MEAYLDNSATTKVYPEVAEMVMKLMTLDYGNPSSLHKKGVDAEHYIKDATKIIAESLKCLPEEIIYTSGGTESNNMAIIGTALAKRRKGKHIVVSSIEHASVHSVMQFLEKEGFEVTYIGTDSKGIVDVESFVDAVRPDTILASCMMVNNEIGAVEPVEKIAKLCKKKNPDIIMHSDCIQAYGKMPIYPGKMSIDLMSVSGHKIHGPKGSGFLYVKKGTLLRPIIYGGGQQKNMRSGTENVPAIAGLGVAVEETFKDFDKKIEHMASMKKRLIENLLKIEDVYDNSGDACHIASLSFKGVRAEVMLHTLEDKQVYVSSGSACSSNSAKKLSGVLNAIGLDKDLLEATLRFSFSDMTTVEEVDYAIQVVNEVLPMLRHYKRG